MPYASLLRLFAIDRPGGRIDDSGGRTGAVVRSTRGNPAADRPGGVAAGGDRAGAGGEGADPAPLRSQQGRADLRAGRHGPRGRHPAVAPVLRQRLFGRRLHARRRPRELRERLQLHRRARQLHDRRLQARRGRVRRAAAVQPPRPPVGARRLARGDAGRLLRHRHEHVEGRPHQLPVPAAVRLGAAHALSDAPNPDAARRRRVHAVVAGARRGLVPVGRRPCTRPQTLPGLGAEVTYLHTQGTVGLDWRTSPGYTPPRRLLRRRRCTTTTIRTTTSASSMVEYEGDCSTSRSCARPGCSRSAAACRHAIEKDGQQMPFFMLPSLGGGSTLRGYSSWRFRDQNSLLLQAEWRIMVNRYLDMAFFYDAGKVAARTIGSRLRRAEGRLRLRRPLPRPVRHAAARRAGQEPREQPQLHLLVVRRPSR